MNDPHRGHRLGYIRVSSEDQNTVRQLDGLPLDKVFTDKVSGGSAKRPQLAALLSHAREGDTVVVHSMDRLARNLDDLRALVNQLTSKGVRVEFVKEGLTFTGGRFGHVQAALECDGGLCRVRARPDSRAPA